MRLSLEEISEDELLCSRIGKSIELENNDIELNPIDKEILLWEWELQRVNQ